MTEHPLVDLVATEPFSTARAGMDQVVAWIGGATETERHAAHSAVRKWRKQNRFHHYSAVIAECGTAPAAEEAAASIQWLAIQFADAVVEVMTIRSAMWLADFSAVLLDNKAQPARAVIDGLVTQGLVERPDSIEYVETMMFGKQWWYSAGEIRAQLIRYPDTTGPDVLTMLSGPEAGQRLYRADSHNGLYSGEDSWCWQIGQLVHEGIVDRAAAIDICLGALERPDEPEPAGWWTAFWKRLKPTPDDCALHAQRLVRLLHSDRSVTVSLAQAVLLPLVRVGRADCRSVLDASDAPLSRAEKKVVLAQLRIIDALAALNPELRGSVTEKARLALSHSRLDVQEAALRVVAIHGDGSGLSEVDRNTLSPAVAMSEENARGTAQVADMAVEGCVARVATLNGALRERWSVDDALRDVTSGRFPALPAPPPQWGTRFEPLTDDPVELAALLGRMTEQESDPVEFHRVLAGVVRSSHLPLDQRARAWGPYYNASSTRRQCEPHKSADVIGDCWAQAPRPMRAIRRPRDLPDVLTVLSYVLVSLMWNRPGTSLLSEPTHAAGVIDPTVLLTRLRGVPDDHPDLDIELASLRLPRDVEEGFWSEAVGRNPSVAARMRQYYDEQTRPSIDVEFGPRNPYVNHVAVRIADAESSNVVAESGVWRSLVNVEHRHDDAWGWNALAPWHHDLVAAHLVRPFHTLMDKSYTYYFGPDEAAALDAPVGMLGPTAHLGLAMALQAGTATTRLPAADTWFTIAADGRLVPAQIADALVQLHDVGELRLNRFVRSIAPTTADPVVAARTLDVLVRAAPRLLDAKARHLHLLFDLAADLAARVGVARIPDELRGTDLPRSPAALGAARRRLANVTSDGPERFDAAAGALQNFLDRLDASDQR